MTKTTQAWQQYWDSGAKESLINYEQHDEIKKFFTDAISSAPAKKSLIDLATGTGSLLRLLEDELGKAKIKAVDIVDIPEKTRAEISENVIFESGVNVTDLPYRKSSFDVAMSLFGLEYGGFREGITEVLRVLRKNGMFVGLVHSFDSALTSLAKKQIQESEIIKDVNIFGQFAKLLTKKKKLSKSDLKKLETLSARLHQARMLPDRQSTILPAIELCKIIYSSLDRKDVIHQHRIGQLNYAQQALEANISRLEHQLASVVTIQDLAWLEAECKNHDFELTITHLNSNNVKPGIGIVIQKAG